MSSNTKRPEVRLNIRIPSLFRRRLNLKKTGIDLEVFETLSAPNSCDSMLYDGGGKTKSHHVVPVRSAATTKRRVQFAAQHKVVEFPHYDRAPQESSVDFTDRRAMRLISYEILQFKMCEMKVHPDSDATSRGRRPAAKKPMPNIESSSWASSSQVGSRTSTVPTRLAGDTAAISQLRQRTGTLFTSK